MTDGSPSLTEQEIEVASTARFDLGSGYPQVKPPRFVRGLIRNVRIQDVGLLMGERWSDADEASTERDLAVAVAALLRCFAPDPTIRATFSGSVALQRAITACVSRARAHGYHQIEVITTSPSIDIIPALLHEHSSITVRFSHCFRDERFPRLDIEGVLALIQSPLPQGASRAVILTSPENPTGEYWTRQELRMLASACDAKGFSLVVDHCFCVAGVQDDMVPTIWEHADVVEAWIGIWDTGKTFGLNGEKLGFLISSKALDDHVAESLRTIQYSVSRRQRVLFARLLSAARLHQYLAGLRAVCRENVRSLVGLGEGRVRCLTPPAGTLALLDVHGIGVGALDFQTALRARGVGVVTGLPFFHESKDGVSLVRFALARDVKLFRTAMEIVEHYIHQF